MASSMKLEYPLNEALPSTEHARDSLLIEISRFRKEHPVIKDEDFELLYAYGRSLLREGSRVSLSNNFAQH